MIAGLAEPEAGVLPPDHAALALVVALLAVDECVAVARLVGGRAVRNGRAAQLGGKVPAVRENDVVGLVQTYEIKKLVDEGRND